MFVDVPPVLTAADRLELVVSPVASLVEELELKGAAPLLVLAEPFLVVAASKEVEQVEPVLAELLELVAGFDPVEFSAPPVGSPVAVVETRHWSERLVGVVVVLLGLLLAAPSVAALVGFVMPRVVVVVAVVVVVQFSSVEQPFVE
jgi:hypothetical protein